MSSRRHAVVYRITIGLADPPAPCCKKAPASTWRPTWPVANGSGSSIPMFLVHVEAAYRGYLKCGILSHGFARAYCADCGHDRPIQPLNDREIMLD